LVRLQDALLVAALPAVLEAVPEPWLAAVLRTGEGDPTGGSHPLLLRRLRHFTRRAQTDFFVHRDLAGFLRAELEFYLKDQIIQLADLDGDLAPRQRMLRVIRELGDDVIAFLDQVESAQKRLFEKRKLVLRTDYLVPVRLVPRALWSAVLADPGQRAAWQDLFRIDPEAPLDEAFLSGHPTLVVDTSHFTEDFRDELLEAFDDLDGVTGGWLIHGENYQALRVLEPRFAGTLARTTSSTRIATDTPVGSP
jgi:adenine-specific DNA-methyltransferase